MWPVHSAKARLSEMLERAEREGPQIITRRGRECSVVLAIEDYRKLVRGQPNLRDYLLGGPKIDDLEVERDHARGARSTFELSSRHQRGVGDAQAATRAEADPLARRQRP